MTDLGTLAGHAYGAAYGVNDLGMIVGWSASGFDCEDQTPVAWLPDPSSKSWKVARLDTTGFGNNFICWEAWKSNRLGQTVGNAIDMSTGGPSAWLWNPLPGGGWKVAKLESVPGYALSMAHDINDRGEISGHVIT